MTPFQLKRREILFSLFDKFPDLSIRGTATILFRDYPEYFNDYESARHLIRLYRGKIGKCARQNLIIKKYFK